MEVLREAVNREKVRLKPETTGKFLWAEYSLGVAASVTRCGNCGSGDSI